MFGERIFMRTKVHVTTALAAVAVAMYIPHSPDFITTINLLDHTAIIFVPFCDPMPPPNRSPPLRAPEAIHY